MTHATSISCVLEGVGSYDAGQAIDALKWKHIAPSGPTANFASHAPRLQPNKSTSAASPGCVRDTDHVVCFTIELGMP